MTDEPDNQNQMDSVSKKKGQLIRVSKIWHKGNVSSPFTLGCKANQEPVPSTPPTLIHCKFYQLQLITCHIWNFHPISCSHTQVWYSKRNLSFSTFTRTPLVSLIFWHWYRLGYIFTAKLTPPGGTNRRGITKQKGVKGKWSNLEDRKKGK